MHVRAIHTLTFPRAMSLWITVAKAYSVAAVNEARAPALWLKMYSWAERWEVAASHQ